MEPSVEVISTEVTHPTLGLMAADASALSLGKIVKEAIPLDGKVMDTEATSHPLELQNTEATPPSLKVKNTESSSSMEVMATSVTSFSQVKFTGVMSELVDDFTELHKHYVVYDTIGSGSSGKVMLGIHIMTGEQVAIKIIEKRDVSDFMWNEIDAMKNLHHQHVCRLYHVIETSNLVCLVLEYCPGGALNDCIDVNEYFCEGDARRLFRQILSALAYIHSQGYVHRDLKLSNLLLDENYNIKLIDFGLCAKPEEGLGSELTTYCGTPHYVAPEILKQKPYLGSETDIWSLGVVLFTMLCGCYPFDNKLLNHLGRNITRGIFDTPDWLSLGSVLLLKQMLQVKPTRQVTVEQLLDHQWVMKGYSSPVEWHSTRSLQQLDQDCIAETALLLNQPEPSTTQLVSEWKYDDITATYLILLDQKQRATEQNLTCSHVDQIQVVVQQEFEDDLPFKSSGSSLVERLSYCFR